MCISSPFKHTHKLDMLFPNVLRSSTTEGWLFKHQEDGRFGGMEEEPQGWDSVWKGSGQMLITAIGIDPVLLNKERDFHKPQRIEFCIFTRNAELLLTITDDWLEHNSHFEKCFSGLAACASGLCLNFGCVKSILLGPRPLDEY